MSRRKPEPTLVTVSRDLYPSTPYRHGMRGTGLDDTVSYTQWWKSKLGEVMAWGIEPTTLRLGARL